MPQIIRPRTGLIFMKVGVHDGEPFEEIVERKREEIRSAGYSFWGYGGGTCHPSSQVQPFAKLKIEEGEEIYLVMEEIDSHHQPTRKVASHYSTDGISWEPIPRGIQVRGSRYAIVLGELREGDLDIDLSRYQVAYGPSRGKTAPEYIKGRVDKACLEHSPNAHRGPEALLEMRKIRHYGKLIDPFAVFVK